jgi:hypothetical protein
MKTLAAAALLLSLCPALSAAAPIYRCGQSYSQTPCPGGKLIDAADPRSAAQRAEARRTAERERQLAARMERERRKEEAAPQPVATGIDATAPARAASQAAPAKGKSSKKKGAKPGDVIVIVPKPNAPIRP